MRWPRLLHCTKALVLGAFLSSCASPDSKVGGVPSGLDPLPTQFVSHGSGQTNSKTLYPVRLGARVGVRENVVSPFGAGPYRESWILEGSVELSQRVVTRLVRTGLMSAARPWKVRYLWENDQGVWLSHQDQFHIGGSELLVPSTVRVGMQWTQTAPAGYTIRYKVESRSEDGPVGKGVYWVISRTALPVEGENLTYNEDFIESYLFAEGIGLVGVDVGGSPDTWFAQSTIPLKQRSAESFEILRTRSTLKPLVGSNGQALTSLDTDTRFGFGDKGPGSTFDTKDTLPQTFTHLGRPGEAVLLTRTRRELSSQVKGEGRTLGWDVAFVVKDDSVAPNIGQIQFPECLCNGVSAGANGNELFGGAILGRTCVGMLDLSNSTPSTASLARFGLLLGCDPSGALFYGQNGVELTMCLFRRDYDSVIDNVSNAEGSGAWFVPTIYYDNDKPRVVHFNTLGLSDLFVNDALLPGPLFTPDAGPLSYEARARLPFVSSGRWLSPAVPTHYLTAERADEDGTLRMIASANSGLYVLGTLPESPPGSPGEPGWQGFVSIFSSGGQLSGGFDERGREHILAHADGAIDRIVFRGNDTHLERIAELDIPFNSRVVGAATRVRTDASVDLVVAVANSVNHAIEYSVTSIGESAQRYTTDPFLELVSSRAGISADVLVCGPGTLDLFAAEWELGGQSAAAVEMVDDRCVLLVRAYGRTWDLSKSSAWSVRSTLGDLGGVVMSIHPLVDSAGHQSSTHVAPLAEGGFVNAADRLQPGGVLHRGANVAGYGDDLLLTAALDVVDTNGAGLWVPENSSSGAIWRLVGGEGTRAITSRPFLALAGRSAHGGIVVMEQGETPGLGNLIHVDSNGAEDAMSPVTATIRWRTQSANGTVSGARASTGAFCGVALEGTQCVLENGTSVPVDDSSFGCVSSDCDFWPLSGGRIVLVPASGDPQLLEPLTGALSPVGTTKPKFLAYSATGELYGLSTDTNANVSIASIAADGSSVVAQFSLSEVAASYNSIAGPGRSAETLTGFAVDEKVWLLDFGTVVLRVAR